MADTLDYEDKIRRDLVASVAHELRTPVAVLQAGHEALLDGVTEPDPEELGSLRDEVLRLARMVDDLQTMAAADAAVLQLTRERHDLADIAGVRRRQPRPQVRDGGGRRWTASWPRRRCSPTSGGCTRWSPTCSATRSSSPRPAAPSRSAPGSDGPSAVLEVADTGVGIPADELPRIFDRFWRGQAAAQTSGSGIGLAIAAELTRGARRHAHRRQRARARRHVRPHPAAGLTAADARPAASTSTAIATAQCLHRRRFSCAQPALRRSQQK